MPAFAADPGFQTIGQEAARTAILRAFRGGRLGRTLLVHGPAGAGKTAFVDDLLALLVCERPDPELGPCNACRFCRQARERSHPDLVSASPEVWREARSSGESIVAAARRWLLEASGAPIAARHRVVLIEGADRANEQTQNALLKSLEEPSPRQLFVLVADEPGRLLPTIRSRCQPLRIGPVAHAELVAWLIEHERLPADQAEPIARMAGGLAGRAVALAGRAPLVEWRRRTQQELLDLLQRGRAERLGSARELIDSALRVTSAAAGLEPLVEAGSGSQAATAAGAEQRAAALLVVDAWLGLTRDLLLTAAQRAELAPAAALLGDVQEPARRAGIGPLVAFVDVLERVREGLRQNASPRLALEVAMLAWPGTDAQPLPATAAR
ncbi:MAG TPA: AAA family ATPase [Candidatus Limnocylindria bacterium]|nr:AAA family ATPase [Candidatus Limnocylindria bacterium]